MDDKLNIKRVQWVEQDAVTGKEYNEPVDIFTRPEAVLFDNGENLEQKLEEIANKIEAHISRSDNPHKATSETTNSVSKEQFSNLEKNLLDHSTVISSNMGYTEVGEWGDGNPNNENRLGYFVAIDTSDDGITMVKANSNSDVRGVTISNPAFGGNATLDKFDPNTGKLYSKYNYVTFAGFAEVYDDGRCTVNERCMPDDDGKAIPSDNNMGYNVIERISNDKIIIIVEPNADMLNRIKSDVDYLEKENTKISDGEYKYKFGKDSHGVFLQVTDIL